MLMIKRRSPLFAVNPTTSKVAKLTKNTQKTNKQETTMEQSAVPVNSQFSITAVETSEVVDSYSLSEKFAALDEVTTFNTSSTLTRSYKLFDA